MYIDIEIIGGHGYIHGKNPSKLGVGIRGPSNNVKYIYLNCSPSGPSIWLHFWLSPISL